MFRFGFEVAKEQGEDPLATGGEKTDLGGVEYLGGEVAAEEAPKGAVAGGGDVVLVAVEEACGGEGWGAIGEGGAVLDEGFVDEGTAGDED